MKLDLRTGGLAGVYVSAVLAVTTWSHLPLVAMTFASSAVLLAAQPDSAAAQPRALIGGHVIAALCGWAVGSLVGAGVAGAAITIGAAAVLMQATRTLHPPAAVSGYLMLQQPGHWTWLIFPIFAGAILLGGLSWVARRLLPPPRLEPNHGPAGGSAAGDIDDDGDSLAARQRLPARGDGGGDGLGHQGRSDLRGL